MHPLRCALPLSSTVSLAVRPALLGGRAWRRRWCRCTRDDLIDLLHVKPASIDVVPLGIGALQREAQLPAAETRARFGLGRRRVLLSLSAKRPHKNLAALIDALATLPISLRPVLVLP